MEKHLMATHQQRSISTEQQRRAGRLMRPLQEVPKEVSKEVPKEVPKDIAKEVAKEVAK